MLSNAPLPVHTRRAGLVVTAVLFPNSLQV